MSRGVVLAGVIAASVVVAPLGDPASAQSPVEQAAEAAAQIDTGRLLRDKPYAEQTLNQLEVLRKSEHYSGEGRFGIDVLRMIALEGTGRSREAFALGRTLTKQKPGDPNLQFLSFSFGVFVDPDSALDELEFADRTLVSEAARKEFRDGIDLDLVAALRQPFYARKDKEKLARSAQALLSFGWPDPDQAAMADSLRRDVVEAKLRRGDLATARTLAAALLAPDTVLPLLVTKRYDPLVEGDRIARLERAVAAFDLETDRATRANPADLKLLLQRAQFLRSVGREADALALVLPVTKDMAAVGKNGEDAFWVVNEAAYALAALNRGDEAIALMKRLLALGFEQHPSLVSMAINTTQIMISAGRYREALDHALKLATEQEDLASPYGKMWMWGGVVCGSYLLGQPGAAAPWLAKLKAREDDNPAALSRAALCANDLDGAAALMVRRLEKDAEQTLIAVQDYQAPPNPPAAVKLLQERWDRVLARPEVKAAIDKHGRILKLPLSRAYWGEF